MSSRMLVTFSDIIIFAHQTAQKSQENIVTTARLMISDVVSRSACLSFMSLSFTSMEASIFKQKSFLIIKKVEASKLQEKNENSLWPPGGSSWCWFCCVSVWLLAAAWLDKSSLLPQVLWCPASLQVSLHRCMLTVHTLIDALISSVHVARPGRRLLVSD